MMTDLLHRTLRTATYALTLMVGIVAFLYPFWLPAARLSGLTSRPAQEAPLMLTLLVGLAFVVLLLEVQSQFTSAKTVALLGVLVAINAALRFVEVAIPGPGGFSPIFFLIVMTGYVFGGRFGFLMGVMTLLVSALITGTIGPWLPYQMFTAGWIGLSAPLCRPVVRLGRRGHAGRGDWIEVGVLALFSGIWGLLFGAIMNIWFWPFMIGEQAWAPGMSLGEILQQYALFYLATSAVWDSLRLVGNTVLVLAFGLPTLRVLRRFRDRFAFDYVPAAPAGRARPQPHRQLAGRGVLQPVPEPVRAYTVPDPVIDAVSGAARTEG